MKVPPTKRKLHVTSNLFYLFLFGIARGVERSLKKALLWRNYGYYRTTQFIHFGALLLNLEKVMQIAALKFTFKKWAYIIILLFYF